MSSEQLPQGFLDAVGRDFPADFLSFSDDDKRTYGRDWTKVHEPRPCAIAFPRTTAEVSKLLGLCNEQGIAVVPSGGRTGLAGGAVAAKGELVVSLERMRQLGKVDPLSRTLRVQAGAITEAVHQHCEPHGLTWPVDFASKGSSQVGGNIATNAGGVKVIRYGLTRQWVLGLEVVLMDGTVLELNGCLEKNNTGVDLRQLFIGSEGTLGIVTEATLKLCRLPESKRVYFFAVDGLTGALRLFEEARSRGPFDILAFEYLSGSCFDVVREEKNLRSPLEREANAYVLLEAESTSGAEQESRLDAWLSGLFESGLVLDGTLASNPTEEAGLWALREGISESLYRKGLLHKNDIALPVSGLASFVSEMRATFDKQYPDLQVYLFGHVGDGNLHVNVLKPEAMSRESFLERCHDADEKLFTLVQRHQGSVSAEHGIGLLKKQALKFSRTPEELAVLRGLKKLLDPKGLLNPGKIFD